MNQKDRIERQSKTSVYMGILFFSLLLGVLSPHGRENQLEKNRLFS